MKKKFIAAGATVAIAASALAPAAEASGVYGPNWRSCGSASNGLGVLAGVAVKVAS